MTFFFSPSPPLWNSSLVFISSLVSFLSVPCVFFPSTLGVGMRGVMRRVSAHLPALIRMCLFDWKAVRSHYAMGATSEDDQGAAGEWSVCLCVCLCVCWCVF